MSSYQKAWLAFTEDEAEAFKGGSLNIRRDDEVLWFAYGEDHIIVQRDGTPTTRFGDGTTGITDEMREDVLKDPDSLISLCVDSDGHKELLWYDCEVDQDGNVLSIDFGGNVPNVVYPESKSFWRLTEAEVQELAEQGFGRRLTEEELYQAGQCFCSEWPEYLRLALEEATGLKHDTEHWQFAVDMNGQMLHVGDIVKVRDDENPDDPWNEGEGTGIDPKYLGREGVCLEYNEDKCWSVRFELNGETCQDDFNSFTELTFVRKGQ